MNIPDDIAARYTNPDQSERFDAGVRKVFSLSPQRAGEIRKTADSIKNPKGRPPKAERTASRAAVVLPPV